MTKRKALIRIPNATVDLITKEEGYRKKVYRCSEGYPTIGIGWKLGPKYAPLDNFKFMEVSKTVARQVLKETITQSYRFLKESSHQPAQLFKELSEERQAIFISMAYQMGDHALHKFTKMMNAIEKGDFIEAANEMLDSRWARQTPERAQRHAEQMRTGQWHPYYLKAS